MMKHSVRKFYLMAFLFCMVVLELAALGCLFSPCLVDDSNLARALAHWHRAPSLETRVELDNAQTWARVKIVVGELALVGIAALNGFGMVKLAKKLKRREKAEVSDA